MGPFNHVGQSGGAGILNLTNSSASLMNMDSKKLTLGKAKLVAGVSSSLDSNIHNSIRAPKDGDNYKIESQR